MRYSSLTSRSEARCAAPVTEREARPAVLPRVQSHLLSLLPDSETSLPTHQSSKTADGLDLARRDTLYAEFQPLVRRLIRQYGDTNESREDLTGEIYYRFCYLLECFDPLRGIPLKPYLVRQLSASIYTYARHQWRRQKREIAMESGAGFGELTNNDDPSRQWDEKLTLSHVRQGLPEVLSQLSLRQRQVVVWRYYEARSFEEIAERLSIQPSTARSILRHGLHNMRHKLTCANYCYE